MTLERNDKGMMVDSAQLKPRFFRVFSAKIPCMTMGHATHISLSLASLLNI